jgi:sugar phosphate isomerase/epimerase
MDLGHGLGHLTYSTLVHQTDNWDQLWKSVNTYLPAVKARVAPHQKFGVCLRTSAPSIEMLSQDPTKRADLKKFFADNDLYLYTSNAFVYGVFKKQIIKEDVYEPDWRTPERREYTKRVANLLAELAPEGINPSIQTAPLGFKPKGTGPDVAQAYTDNVVDVVAHLVKLEKDTGKIVTLGLEPEPSCLIETTEDAVTFFETYLFNEANVQAVAGHSGVSFTLDDVRTHVGVCLDACHMAVEFEDPAEAIARLRDTGIRIVKVQLSSAIELPAAMSEEARLSALGPFSEDTYLHQVVQRTPSGLVRFVDLPDALAQVPTDGREWRVHFHMPIFLPELTGVGTTQPYLASVLDLLRREQVCPLLEVETYTWSVLPPEYRGDDVCTAIGRELEWVRRRLQA